MLFCQQKNAKRVATITALVVLTHFFAVWFVCLKRVVHHCTIPLSILPQSIKIKLNRVVPVVKSQAVQSVQKQRAKKPAPITQKKSKVSAKKNAQKASVSSSIKASGNTAKTIETKKTPVKEVQKIVKRKEVEETKKVSDGVAVDDLIQQKNDQAFKSIVDHEEVAKNDDITSKADYYEAVYKTIIEQWRPPIGIVKGTSCTVSFTIDQKGLPIDVVFEKKSGVLMFDMSIKTVLAHSIFSSLFVGNRFSIVFTV
jgi:hypothetical protein